VPEIKELLKVTKYQLSASKSSVISFTLGMLALMLFILFVSVSADQIRSGAGSTQVNGLDGFGFLWILVLTLNSFGHSFKYMQSNGVSRKRFFIASVPFFLVLAVYGTVFMQTITYVLNGLVWASFFAEGLYPNAGYISMFFWTFMNYLAIASAAWLYIIFLYRTGSRFRTLIILATFLVPIVGNAVDQYYSGGFVVDSIRRFVSAAMGLSVSAAPNIYLAILSLTLFSIACFVLAFAVVRKLELDR
jgi:hypothetical protein